MHGDSTTAHRTWHAYVLIQPKHAQRVRVELPDLDNKVVQRNLLAARGFLRFV